MFQEDLENLNKSTTNHPMRDSDYMSPQLTSNMLMNFAPQESISSSITNRLLKNGDELQGELNQFKNRLVAIEREM